MSVLSLQALAESISNSDCGNCQTINDDVVTELDAGSAIVIATIGSGGSGVDSSVEGDIYDTLIQISRTEAATVNGNIQTGYKIISENGFPN